LKMLPFAVAALSFSLRPLPFSLQASQAASPQSLHRSSAVRLDAAAKWAPVAAASSRAAAVEAIGALKAGGAATLWGEFKLAPRPVTLRELCQTTRLDEKVLDPTATEFSLSDIQDVFIKVIIGCTVGATAWAVGSDALGLDAGLRFTGTYLFAGIPIGILAVGSTAPGILFLPVEAFRAAVANEEEKRTRALRVCKHEAAHLLCAYTLGLPVQEVVADEKGPRVVVFDEELSQQPGQFVDASQVDALAVVAMSGFMAEADAYGKALGASEDLKLLNSILLRCTPPIPAQKQQDTTRYAALMAWTIVKKYEAAYDAIVGALSEGKGLVECLRAAEDAHAVQGEAKAAAAAARAEAIAKETPQERAAREREEMAARGRF